MLVREPDNAADRNAVQVVPAQGLPAAAAVSPAALGHLPAAVARALAGALDQGLARASSRPHPRLSATAARGCVRAMMTRWYSPSILPRSH